MTEGRSPEPDLSQQSTIFARDLAESLGTFAGVDVELKASQVGSKIAIQSSPEGIPFGLRELLTLGLDYRCILDSSETYLSVDRSTISVYAGRPRKDPLFRYEYVREMQAELPAAHLHVHAHRDEFTYVMAMAGHDGATRRRPDKSGSVEPARIANLHFPVGGHRFRPCLEDILEFLVVEFGVEAGDGWRERAEQARKKFRLTQVAAVVRDAPGDAARALEGLGYSVVPPETGDPDTRLDRIGRW